MHNALRLVAISILGVALIILETPPAVMAMTWTVDDPSDGIQCTGATFTSIEAAVSAVTTVPGDIIVVCNGNYAEQVVIDKSLTIQAAASSQGDQAVVTVPPGTMADPKAIILVTGMLTNVTIDGLIVAGPGTDSCDSIRYGIRVDGGASATLTHNMIKDIHDTPFGGCQNGIGILVGHAADGTTGSANIQENIIEAYQKGGIVIDNGGSTAVILSNVIIGVGRTQVIAQNGVQVSRGAMVPPTNLQGNTITENFYLNRSPSTTPAVGTGILYFQAGDPGFAGPLNSGNTLRHNQINVSIVP